MRCRRIRDARAAAVVNVRMTRAIAGRVDVRIVRAAMLIGDDAVRVHSMPAASARRCMSSSPVEIGTVEIKLFQEFFHGDLVEPCKYRIGAALVDGDRESFSAMLINLVTEIIHVIQESSDLFLVSIAQTKMRYQSFLPSAIYIEPFFRFPAKMVLVVNRKAICIKSSPLLRIHVERKYIQ